MSTYFKDVVVLTSYLSLMISINILQCIAVEILPAKPKEDANSSSRGGLLQLNPYGSLAQPDRAGKLTAKEAFEKMYLLPSGAGGKHPVPSPRVLNVLSTSIDNNNNNNKTNIPPDNSGPNSTPTPTPSLDELEKALLEPGVECGRVPLFENLYKRSINESFDKNPDAENEGEARILHGLDAQA